jgi:hypothetical protein
MEALEDSELFEFSTQHFESDSHRIEKGDWIPELKVKLVVQGELTHSADLTRI